MAVNDFGQIVSCYYSRLATTGHLNPNEAKNIFAAMVLKDYIDNYYPEFIKPEELDCLNKLYNKVVSGSCLLSQAFIC